MPDRKTMVKNLWFLLWKRGQHILNGMRDGHNISLVPGKLWDERKRLEGQDSGKGPQLVTLNCTGFIAADLQLTDMNQGRQNQENPTGKHLGNIWKELRGAPLGRWHIWDLSCIYINVQTAKVGSNCAARKLWLFVLTGTWWGECLNWMINGYRQFKGGRRGRRGGEVGEKFPFALIAGSNVETCTWRRIMSWLKVCNNQRLSQQMEPHDWYSVQVPDQGEAVYVLSPHRGCILLTGSSCWGTSAIPVSARKAAHGDVGNPGDC